MSEREAEATRPRCLPPTYLLLAIILMAALHFAIPLAHAGSWGLRLVGAALVAAGVALNLVADRQFKTRGTTVKPFEPSAALVTDGAFRISRHPMYLGMIVGLLGWAALLGSPWPFLGALLFAWWITSRFLVPEERDLARQFGDAYAAYCRKVRRWL